MSDSLRHGRDTAAVAAVACSRRRQPAERLIVLDRAAKRRQTLRGVAASRLRSHPTPTPRADARGYLLPPLRGWAESSRISLIASFRLERASSRVVLWPLVPGTSGQKATNQAPSCSMTAVNSLCMAGTAFPWEKPAQLYHPPSSPVKTPLRRTC